MIFDVRTVTRAAVEIQQSPAAFRQAAAELGVEPALIINGAEHYTRSDIDRIAEYLRKPKEVYSQKDQA